MSLLYSSSSAYATLSDSDLVTEVARLAGCERHATAARLKSKRDIEVLVAGLRPLPPVPSVVRKLPVTSLAPATDLMAPTVSGPTLRQSASDAASEVAAATHAGGVSPSWPATFPPGRPTVIAPLTPEQYKVQVTVGRETIEKLRRAQDLMRHTLPDGDPAVVLDRALTVLLAHLERTKLALTERARKGRELTVGSRHVPAAVRRAVWARDQGQCAFVTTTGRRCQARGCLEFHHSAPYAAGGEATVAIIELRCRAHNLYEAELDFGPSVRHHGHGRLEPHP